MSFKVLMVGDIVGKLGRRTVAAVLPELRQTRQIDLVVANGENTAGGRGLTAETADELYKSGIDVITSGNHIWENREVYPLFERDERLIRPLNYPPDTPGKGVYRKNDVAVVNAMGRAFMGQTLDCPFRAIEEALDDLRDCHVILVDLHAEATSEKVGMGYYLDGRVSGVVGTHTHIPTSDTRVLPRGTAYVTDLGMCGALHSVLGMEIEPVLQRFLTQRPNRWNPVDRGPAVFNSVIIDIDTSSGKAITIERLDREVA